MINFAKERELFLYELNGRGFIFESTKWLGNCFEDELLNMTWEMWQASVDREGYVLVPIEPTKEMLEALYCGFEYMYDDSCFNPHTAFEALLKEIE